LYVTEKGTIFKLPVRALDAAEGTEQKTKPRTTNKRHIN